MTLHPVPEVHAELLTELHTRWAVAAPGRHDGDVYSAVCLPDSWEYALPASRQLRELLRQCGYQPVRDSDAERFALETGVALAHPHLIWRRYESDGHGARRA